MTLAKRHFAQDHANNPVNIIITAPTINKELRCADELHASEVRHELAPNELSLSSPLEGAVQNVNLVDFLTPSISMDTEHTISGEQADLTDFANSADMLDIGTECRVSNYLFSVS